jgi:predicted AAA+ superfamily ATPase
VQADSGGEHELYDEPERRYWFFDEITYVSGWAAAL